MVTPTGQSDRLGSNSYGYQTLFANWVGEIRKYGLADEWWWISGELNIADVIYIKEPSLLSSEPTHYVRKDVVAWVWRAAKEQKKKLSNPTLPKSKREAFSLKEETTKQQQRWLSEGQCWLFRNLRIHEETSSLQPNREWSLKTVPSAGWLCIRMSSTVSLCVAEEFSSSTKVTIPILPHSTWISTLLANKAHNAHCEILLRMRKRAWVLKGGWQRKLWTAVLYAKRQD